MEHTLMVQGTGGGMGRRDHLAGRGLPAVVVHPAQRETVRCSLPWPGAIFVHKLAAGLGWMRTRWTPLVRYPARPSHVPAHGCLVCMLGALFFIASARQQGRLRLTSHRGDGTAVSVGVHVVSNRSPRQTRPDPTTHLPRLGRHLETTNPRKKDLSFIHELRTHKMHFDYVP